MRAIAVFLVLVTAGAAHADHEMDGRDIGNGERLYQEVCASCHGVRLEGQPDWQRQNPDGSMPAPPHDASGHTWHHGNEQLFDYTRLGGAEALARMGVTGVKSAMPAFGDQLSEDEIWDILAFIRSTWPRRAREVQASRNVPHE